MSYRDYIGIVFPYSSTNLLATSKSVYAEHSLGQRCRDSHLNSLPMIKQSSSQGGPGLRRQGTLCLSSHRFNNHSDPQNLHHARLLQPHCLLHRNLGSRRSLKIYAGVPEGGTGQKRGTSPVPSLPP